MNIKELLDELKEEARELIDLGDSHEKREGHGMLRVIDAMENLPDHAGESNPDDKIKITKASRIKAEKTIVDIIEKNLYDNSVSTDDYNSTMDWKTRLEIWKETHLKK